MDWLLAEEKHTEAGGLPNSPPGTSKHEITDGRPSSDDREKANEPKRENPGGGKAK